MPDKKIVVIMPADKVEDTLRRTIAEGWAMADHISVVDHRSNVALARRLGLHSLIQPKSREYGGNPKTSDREAPRLHDSPLELLPGTTAGMGTSLYTPIPSYAAP